MCEGEPSKENVDSSLFDNARATQANKDRRWLAALAQKQNARNRQRKIDEERNQAASKIQGLYRGHKDRQIVKSVREKQKIDAEEKKAAAETEEGRLENDMERLFGD